MMIASPCADESALIQTEIRAYSMRWSVRSLVLSLIIFALGNLTALRDNKNYPQLFRRQFILIRNNFKGEVGPFHLCSVSSTVRVSVFIAGGEDNRRGFPPSHLRLTPFLHLNFKWKSHCRINGNESSLQLVSPGTGTHVLLRTAVRCPKVPLCFVWREIRHRAPLPL